MIRLNILDEENPCPVLQGPFLPASRSSLFIKGHASGFIIDRTRWRICCNIVVHTHPSPFQDTLRHPRPKRNKCSFCRRPWFLLESALELYLLQRRPTHALTHIHTQHTCAHHTQARRQLTLQIFFPQEVEMLTSSLSQLKMVQGKLNVSAESLTTMRRDGSKDILVPLTGSVSLRAVVK